MIVGAIVLDCPDPMELAGFYAGVLDGAIDPESTDDWAQLTGDKPVLAFQRADDHQRPQWPDGSPQQVHLDFEVDSYQPLHDRVIALGGAALDPTTPPADGDRSFRVYADPAGHPFCLCMC
jgi:catechol-2,3-dioxygenase